MPPVIIENEEFIPPEFRNSFKQLTNKVSHLAKVDVCKSLTGGYSESVPVLVCATYEHSVSYQVFKIGEKDIINKEAQNWETFIKNGPYEHWHIVHLKEHIKGSPRSLIVYHFAGKFGKEPLTFEDLYKESENPEDMVKYLFEGVLKLFANTVWKGINHPPIKDILDTISRNTARITTEVEKLCNCKASASPKIKINVVELYNPVYFYPFKSNSEPNKMAIPIPQGIVHGDLNPRNILFYETGSFMKEGVKRKHIIAEIPCIIDYAHTGKGSLYTDIARLESFLKFHLFEVDQVNPNMLLQFEQENVLGDLIPSHNPPITDPHLQKLFSCIMVLRKIASRIINNGDYVRLGFWLELYKHTLLHLKYDISDCQKRYAFISASIIFTRYLAK